MKNLCDRRPGQLPRGLTLAASLLFALLVPGCRFETVPEENVEVSVETMLDRMAEAWNDGDLDGVMSFYADAASTTLVTPEGPVFGRDAIRAVYAPWFDTGARRPRVRFEEIQVRTLPPLVGIVTGRRVVRSTSLDSGAGWFTLVVRRVGDGWRIVHDHPDFAYTPVSKRGEIRPATDGPNATGRNAGKNEIEEST